MRDRGCKDPRNHGFDRFGRTIDHRWVNYSGTPTDVSRLKYGYDYAGNRQWREDVVAGANNHDEYYTYDGTHMRKISHFGTSIQVGKAWKYGFSASHGILHAQEAQGLAYISDA